MVSQALDTTRTIFIGLAPTLAFSTAILAAIYAFMGLSNLRGLEKLTECRRRSFKDTSNSANYLALLDSKSLYGEFTSRFAQIMAFLFIGVATGAVGIEFLLGRG